MKQNLREKQHVYKVPLEQGMEDLTAWNLKMVWYSEPIITLCQSDEVENPTSVHRAHIIDCEKFSNYFCQWIIKI